MELKNIRGANLERWIREDPHAEGVVTAWCDYYSQFLDGDERPFSPQHIRNLAKPDIADNESFGEKMARKIERATGRQRYSLDEPPGQVSDAPAGYRTREHGADEHLVRLYQKLEPERREIVDLMIRRKRWQDMPPGVENLLRGALQLLSMSDRERQKNSAA